jgi:hypothetical protein
MYLFLDPDPIGRLDHDSFVFSHDHTREHYGEGRRSLVRVHPSWRSWHVEDERVHIVTTTVPDVWVPAVMTLASASVPLNVDFPEEGRLVDKVLSGYSQALTSLDVYLYDEVSVQTLTDYSWAPGTTETLPGYSSWQRVNLDWFGECSCAPTYPEILWNVNEKGVATAHEDRRAAAIKQRSAIVQLEASSDASGTRIRVGVGTLSLVHRTQGRLPKSKSTDTAWRLITDHFDLAPQPIPKIRL